MYHTRDYSILMTLVAKLYNIYNSMKSRRIFGPIEAVENLLLTLGASKIHPNFSGGQLQPQKGFVFSLHS